MRLLYVCSDWGISPDGTKGAAIHLRAITKALAESGHEVSLLSPKGAPGNGHPAGALFSERCAIAEDAARLLRDWLDKRELPQGIGREIRPLLFNAWALKPALAALRAHPPDAIIERLSLFGHLGLDLSEALNCPLILEVNAPLTREASDFRSLQLQTLASEIEQRVLRRAARVGVVSRQLGEQFVIAGIDPGKIDVIPNGIEPSAFAVLDPRDKVRARFGLGDGFVLGFAGSLKPWHGVGLLIEAFSVIAKRDLTARLLLIGTGPTEDDLRRSVARTGLGDRVVFAGAVPHEQIPNLLSVMDVAAAPFLPVQDFYFSPIKLFEYMASGACVVASRAGQIAEVIEHGIDGLLAEPGSLEDLVNQIETVRVSPSLRKKLSERASAKVHSHYTWPRAARDLSTAVERAIHERSIAGRAAAVAETMMA